MDQAHNILNAAESFVSKYLEEELSPDYVFHTLAHTQDTIEVCKKLAKELELEREERLMALLAIWFHPIGNIREEMGDQEAGFAIAQQFLARQGVGESCIQKVSQLIRASNLAYVPCNQLEAVVHDANWAFLGRKRFFRLARRWRLEKEFTKDKSYGELEWNKFLLEILLKHRFYTVAAQEKYLERKAINIEKQREKTLRLETKERRRVSGKDYGRGIDTMYRNTLRGHLNLSSIADGKANMIISINALILSILITVITAGSSFTDYEFYRAPHFLIPILVLMFGSLSAVIFAVLSVIPRSSKADFSVEEVRKHEVSLLFFNKFLKVERDLFLDYLEGLKEDEEKLYRNLGRDIYNLGTVLDKKYRLLNISYKLFLGGLIMGFLSFSCFQLMSPTL